MDSTILTFITEQYYPWFDAISSGSEVKPFFGSAARQTKTISESARPQHGSGRAKLTPLGEHRGEVLLEFWPDERCHPGLKWLWNKPRHAT
jgi:hypothetical protein